MPEMSQQEREQRDRGERAENVAAWYFRLNGFLSIPGFVVHRDDREAYIPSDGIPRIARTEADFMGVRFANSQEKVGGRLMEDDAKLLHLVGAGSASLALFVLVEVKAGLCRMNGPWTNHKAKNMERVVRRLGFATNERQIEDVADAMYRNGRWQDDAYVLQYICVGGQKPPDLITFSQLLQIDWDDIADFLLRRFQSFPEKLPSGYIHEQWPDFGRKYSLWFTRNRRGGKTAQDSIQAVREYIATGRCDARPNRGG